MVAEILSHPAFIGVSSTGSESDLTPFAGTKVLAWWPALGFALCALLLSAVIDNVPLVAATMGMYDLAVHPTDSELWEFLAFAAGTGGSCLIIGSAAGVAAMGMERINFFWYVRNISGLALLGYVAGSAVIVLEKLPA